MKRRILPFVFVLLIGTTLAQTAPQSLIVEHADVPFYPPIAKEAHITGDVQVEVTVKNGVVTGTLVKSSAHPTLVNATLENLKTWKLASGANATFITTYTYQLAKDEAPAPENPRIEMQLPTLVKVIAKPSCNDCQSALPMQHFDQPTYPSMARIAHIFGTVEVEVTVKEGSVVKTEVKSGHAILAQATIDNIRTWRFQSAVNATFTTKFNYEIVEKGTDLQTVPAIKLDLPHSVTVRAFPIILDSQSARVVTQR